MRRWLRGFVFAALLALAASGQLWLRARHADAAPAATEGVLALLGGMRSLAAEIVWFRADQLQTEGRYVELAQLATLLSHLEPHTPEVWSHAAWNLAYNVSVMMPTPEDRWRWVLSALRLLRDDGLRLNPHSPELYRELAWLFELKLGVDIDSAAGVYRQKWREIVAEVAARDAWSELGMNPELMSKLAAATVLKDYADPLFSAAYWASAGMPFARGQDRAVLATIIEQCGQIAQRRLSGAKTIR